MVHLRHLRLRVTVGNPKLALTCKQVDNLPIVTAPPYSSLTLSPTLHQAKIFHLYSRMLHLVAKMTEESHSWESQACQVEKSTSCRLSQHPPFFLYSRFFRLHTKMLYLATMVQHAIAGAGGYH